MIRRRMLVFAFTVLAASFSVVGSVAAEPGYVEQVKPGVLSWLESVRYQDEGWGRWKYHAAMQRPYALQASGSAVGILQMLGELDRIGDKERQEAIAFFRSCQDPDDHLFKDPLETDDCYTGYHSWEQVWGQRNGSALSALERLGAEPLMPRVKSQFGDLSRVDGRRWTLEQIDWTNPWKNGESWSRAIKAYLATLPSERRNDKQPVLAAAFEAVEAEIFDPATGTPCRRMPKQNPSVAMAGLFKVISGYLAAGRAVPHAQAGIDSTLALQHEDGEFGYRNNMCINWDALWVLRELDRQLKGTHRHQDIVDAGNRCARMLLRKYRKPDGGFAFHGERCITVHHSIRLCDKPQPISDMLGTSMCLRCLSYADEWNKRR